MDKIIIPDIKLNIDQYGFMAPVIAASLTNAVYLALSMKKTDETDEEVIHRVIGLWSELTSTIEQVSSKFRQQDKQGEQS